MSSEQTIRSTIESLYDQLSNSGFDVTQLSRVKIWLKMVYLDEFELVDESLLDKIIDDYLYEVALMW